MVETDQAPDDPNAAVFVGKLFLAGFAAVSFELISAVLLLVVFDPPHPGCPDWTITADNGSKSPISWFIFFPAVVALALGFGAFSGKKRWAKEAPKFTSFDLFGFAVTDPRVVGSVMVAMWLVFGAIPFFVYWKTCF